MEDASAEHLHRVRRLNGRLARLLDRLQPSETSVLITTALIVGVGTGIGAILFIELIAGFQRFFGGPVLGALAFLGPVAPAFVSVTGALIAGPLITYFASEAKGHGVPEVMEAIALRGGRIRPIVVIVKVLASAACIGSGGSAGREGPITAIIRRMDLQQRTERLRLGKLTGADFLELEVHPIRPSLASHCGTYNCCMSVCWCRCGAGAS